MNPRSRVTLASTIICLLIITATGPAVSHAIDGAWCHEDGRSMRIDGDMISIDGHTIAGTYQRHSYTYTSPPGPEGRSGVTSMVLKDDNTLLLTPPSSTHVTIGSSIQRWRRCEAIS